MAQNPSNIIPDQLIVVEGGKQLVPAPSSGDSGKVLGVLNSNGDIGWTEDREGMAQQQADWAEDDPSKVTYIANKPSGQMAPSSTSSDSGKVLKVDAQGVPVWGDVSGVAEFLWSTVTRADVDAAIADGKMPVILDDTFSGQKTYCYLYNTHSASPADTLHFASFPVPGSWAVLYHTQSATIWVLSFNPGGVKSRESKNVAAEITSDNSITLLDDSGKLKITVANPLPASTSVDEGKVLTVNSSGSAEWANASAGTAEFSWSTVTKNDVETALTAGKSVVINYASGSESIPCYYTKSMTTNNGTEYTFVSQELRGTLDSTNQSANVVKLVISGTGAKTQTTVPVGAKIVSDGSITIANGSNADEISISTNAVPASTSADADKVLTVNSSGTPEWATAQGGGGGGALGGTTIPADEPVKVSFTGTSTGGSFPGSVIMAGSDVLGNSPIVCIHVPKLALEYSQFTGGDFTTDYTLRLYDNNTYKADIATTKAYYSNGKYRLVFPERWLYYNTLPALESGHYYVLKVSYTALGSSNTPSGSVEFFPYNANGKYLIPGLVVDQTSILNTRNVYQTPPGMQTVSINLDSNKGIVDKTTHSYSDTTHTLSIDNTSVYRDGSGQYPSDFTNNTEQIKGAVALSNATYYIPTPPYTESKFPVARMVNRASGSNSSLSDFLFTNFLDQRSPEFGTVYIVHIEGPATSTGSADCPCICRFSLCEQVEDWETMSQQQYFYHAVLPGVYVHSEQKVVADGVITISQTHSNGMFQSQFYTPPYIVSLDPNTTITGTFGYVSDWNICVSRI